MHTIFLLILISLPKSFAQVANYKMADLEYLESSKSYREFINHVYDIRPTQRTRQWKEMLLNMSTDFLEKNLKRKRFFP